MYAVIETGGKQYRVAQGDVIEIERTELSGKAKEAVQFDRVLMVSGDKGVQVGDPVVAHFLLRACRALERESEQYEHQCDDPGSTRDDLEEDSEELRCRWDDTLGHCIVC